MDPVTTAILAAIAAGVASGGPKAVEAAVVDAYGGLKRLLQQKFGPQSTVIEAVEKVEAKPEREGYRVTLREEIQEAEAEKDPEILQAAELLQDQIKQQPHGDQLIQQIVNGNNNVFSATGNVYVNQHPR
jgi:hypothetical protein